MKNPVTAIRLPLRPGREYESRFDREQSLFRMLAIPIASVVFASMVTTMPFLTQQPILPPFGLPDVPCLATYAPRPAARLVWASRSA